ncbi:MAG: prepilin-type cleavage/methylation domain-containing protein, partial [Chthonomonas sp.]|nr:prepilin-type cleavage/methylation domain-containing protein [Chthonomonas sp.]
MSIAIITVLAGVLLPTFARAKTAAASTHSVNNLRQISVSWLLYSDSYEDICM